MRFRSLSLIFATAILTPGFCLAQTPAANPSQDQSATQSQTKPDSASDKGQASSKPEESDGNVLVLRTPKMPQQEQFKPELRAVDLEKRPKMSEATRRQLISLMDAEFAHTRKYFPLGDRSLTITPDGAVTPADTALFQEIQAKGAAAKVGDRVQVTNIFFREKSILLQINGGPKRKGKWYQHLSIGVGGAGGGVEPLDPNQGQPTGAEFVLQFNKPIPEMNADELRKLLSPVLDFGLKSAGEVYAETLPPKLREAIKHHEVLVGMNKDMVVLAKERPQQKVRDKDESGKPYEEWIYGTPPQDVVFVRFVGDEVTQVKLARVGQQTIVKTEKEVDVKDGVVTLASLSASNSPQDVKKKSPEEEQQQPVKRPTLRRPGEGPDPDVQQRQPNGPVATPQSEPEWGSNGKKPSGDDNQQEPPKPPQ